MSLFGHDKSYKIRRASSLDIKVMSEIFIEGASQATGSNFLKGIAHKTIIDWISAKLKNTDPEFGCWVAFNQFGVIGWQSLTKIESNPLICYLSAETSTYVSAKSRSTGVAKGLIEFALNDVKESRLRYVIGFVDANNTAVLKVAEHCGFNVSDKILSSSKCPDEKILIIIKNL